MNKKIIIALIFLLSPFFVFAQEIDSDNDGINDNDEIKIYLTDPLKADTDDDGFNDKHEIDNWYSPIAKDKKMREMDSDKDDLDDEFEIKLGTNINDPDSDDDGFWDGLEVARGFDPLNAKMVKVKKNIKVSLKDQKLVYYFGDTKLDEFLISGGVASMPTPKGNFKILKKFPSKDYGGNSFDFSYPDTKWNLHFTTKYWRYYIHGAYWHNDFGKPKSHGCVNVADENMERVYYWAQVGTELEIT
jgi:hypothetical protein